MVDKVVYSRCTKYLIGNMAACMVLCSCWLNTDRAFIWSFIAPVIATLVVRFTLDSMLNRITEFELRNTLCFNAHFSVCVN